MVTLTPLINSEFGMRRLLESAEPGRLEASGLFVPTFEPDALAEALERVEALRAARSESGQLRAVLGKKLGETKDTEFKSQFRDLADRIPRQAASLPISEAWMLQLVQAIREAGEEVEQAFADAHRREASAREAAANATTEAREAAQLQVALLDELRASGMTTTKALHVVSMALGQPLDGPARVKLATRFRRRLRRGQRPVPLRPAPPGREPGGLGEVEVR